MPGVFRPYTLVDVLGTMNDNSTQQTANDQIDGLSNFAQTNETFTVSDTVTGTPVVATTTTWDAVTWGTFAWG